MPGAADDTVVYALSTGMAAHWTSSMPCAGRIIHMLPRERENGLSDPAICVVTGSVAQTNINTVGIHNEISLSSALDLLVVRLCDVGTMLVIATQHFATTVARLDVRDSNKQHSLHDLVEGLIADFT